MVWEYNYEVCELVKESFDDDETFRKTINKKCDEGYEVKDVIDGKATLIRCDE